MMKLPFRREHKRGISSEKMPLFFRRLNNPMSGFVLGIEKSMICESLGIEGIKPN